LTLVLLFAGNWSCRDKPVIEKSVNEESNLTKPKQITTEEKKLLNFAKITFTDTTNISSLLVFKLINENGEVSISDSEQNAKIYKNILKGKATSILPIFEIIGSDKEIFVVQNRGNIGGIWAKFLVDKKSN